LWVKDVVEAADAVWGLCVGIVIWSLGRARTAGNDVTAWLGLAGGIGFALFSIFVPLTEILVPMQLTRSMIQVVAPAALLIASSAVGAGLLSLRAGSVSGA
jgi:hypothetical protein